MKKFFNDQAGIASIYVTVIFSIIISIVVLSFVIISRREQRQSLDRLLSSQAYYAAESGINDAISSLKKDPTYTQNNCIEKELDKDKFIFQSCTLVSFPDKLTYDVSTTNSKFFIVKSQTTISSLKFTWRPLNSTDVIASPSPSCAPPNIATCFKPDTTSGWNNQMGVLRLEVMEIPKTGTIKRSDILTKTYHLFGIPDGGTNNTFNLSSGSTPSDKNSAILSGACTSVNPCSISLNNINSAVNDYYVRAFSYYKDIRLEVTNNVGATFIGSQINIDSTGRSGDVLRRVNVTKTISSLGNSSSTPYLPPFVLSAGDGLCKKLESNPNTTTIANSAAVCN